MKYDYLQTLKKEKDAVILAHYYVDEEIQKLADYVGDSFFLAQLATKLENPIIVMAGVNFMGESIKILNPDKKVYLLDPKADCPMARMADIKAIENIRKEYDDIAIVSYINSTAEIKAHCDVCVTSSNAVNIVKKLKEKNIFFLPDKNLGAYIAEFVPEKNIILNDGYCPVHNKISPQQIWEYRKKYKDIYVLAHPECQKSVLDLADYIGSTKGIIEKVNELDSKDFLIVTEEGIKSELKKRYPDKKFHFLEDFTCKDMKMLTVEKLIDCIEKDKNEVFVDEKIAKLAIKPLNMMMKLGE